MAWIPKPQNRESTILFGDGDEAVFGHISSSSVEGYNLVHLRPTQKMAWKRQIQMSESEGFDNNDGWWKKIYKKDLCIQLNADPDFPMWLILCNYLGHEETPLMEHFVKCRLLTERNRDLGKEVRNLRAELNRKRLNERKRALHPDEEFLEFEERTKRLISAGVIAPTIAQPPHEDIGRE